MIKLRIVLLVILSFIFLYSLLYPFIQQDESEIDASKDSTISKEPVIEKEQPLHNVNLPDFSAIKNVKTKKRQFFNFIEPAVNKENNHIMSLRKQLLAIKSKVVNGETIEQNEFDFIQQLSKEYRVNAKETNKQINALLTKVDVIPKALVLVQAANESAWGTSRFARIGLNFFGVWCFTEGCGMVPNSRDEDADHEVAAYTSVKQAVKRYLHNINTNSAYSVFRNIRKNLRDNQQPLVPEVLATGLIPYSERGSDYVEEITDMLRHNQGYFVPEVGIID
ncbi:glucosaminidase domain-containing protein [Thalassotalea profundi]|uniref:Glycoside hydrolase family 73 n=1 Tax=Thalassotalea profundi TaxID=2036687 RepID=A0ABQ3J5M4_9GAMM|nr:glucosaminidase domain-containing protein [Thalassotalea profundi]GHF01148.1 glycoside hydrolase family 73 [Thalassotalea profundi]